MDPTGAIEAVIWDLGGVILRTEDRRLRAAWESRLGFQRAAPIPDFYREGDPLVLYVKSLQPDPQRTGATLDQSA